MEMKKNPYFHKLLQEFINVSLFKKKSGASLKNIQPEFPPNNFSLQKFLIYDLK